MTRLTIIPNAEKKRLVFDGKIASGEHVELRVVGFGDRIEDGRLRVRAVDFRGNTLAAFPGKVKDEEGNEVWEKWGVDEDYGYATCVFNLNTIPALKYFRRGGECLIVLDNPELETLYGSGHLCVLPWPKEIGDDEPVDLDAYPDNIREFGERLDVVEDEVEKCGHNVREALNSVSNANANARTAATTAQNALSASEEAKRGADGAAEDARRAAVSAENAEAFAQKAKDSAQTAKNVVDSLADVARSGSYNDLFDKPEIPSIAGLAKKEEVDHVENVLRGELNDEISRAKKAEEDLGRAVGAKADASALNGEKQRAEKAEAEIRGSLANKASLDASGKVPAAQLPSYVDDVMEFASESRFPRPGESGKIYIATDTNRQYRWSGTQYAEISSSLALGETAQTAYPGDKGNKNAADISALKAGKQDKLSEYVKSAAKSADGTMLTLTKQDGTVVEFKGGGSDSYSKSEIDTKLSDKADEFTAWVADIPDFDRHSEIVFHDDKWYIVQKSNPEYIVGKGDKDSTELSWGAGEWWESADVTVTRKRVLRTGDADKLTEAQKTMLGGGPYLKTVGGVIKEQGFEDSEGILLSPSSSSGVGCTLSVGRTVDAGGTIIVRGGGYDQGGSISVENADDGSPASIKKGGKEVATEEFVEEAVEKKVDEFTAWSFSGDEGDWSIEFREEEHEETPYPIWFADLLNHGEVVHTVAVENQDVVSIAFRWGEDGMVDVTRQRVLRTGAVSDAIKTDPMPTEDLTEGSVAARVVALEDDPGNVFVYRYSSTDKVLKRPDGTAESRWDDFYGRLASGSVLIRSSSRLYMPSEVGSTSVVFSAVNLGSSSGRPNLLTATILKVTRNSATSQNFNVKPNDLTASICAVNPDSKTDEMTQSVGVGADGKLWTVSAEDACNVNPSTSLALKNRDCCLVAYTEGMTFTFVAKEEGQTGLRSFEVIVTGCVKDGAVNWPAVTYRGDATDLIPDDGDNHWTFAEQQDGSFAVTRHVANTFTIGD